MRLDRTALLTCWAGTLGIASVAPAADRYDITGLFGPIPSIGTTINAAGDVAGTAGHSFGPAPLAIWSAENGLTLIPSDGNRIVLGLSDDRTLAGGYQGQALGWAFNAETGFLCLPGPGWCGPQFLYAASRAYGVSRNGLITGFVSQEAPEGSWPIFLSSTEAYIAAIEDDGSISVQRLGLFGSQFTVGWAINDAGLVVGTAGNSPNFTAILFRDGAVEALPDLGGSFNRPEAITNGGRIAGFVSDPVQENGGFIAGSGAVWTIAEDGAVTLTAIGQYEGPLGSSNVTWLSDINDQGIAVGFARRMENSILQWEVPIVWSAEEGIRSLNDLLETEEDWRFLVVRAINDAGEIAGSAQNGIDAPQQAVRLTPLTTDSAVIGDLDGDGRVDIVDLLIMLSAWGPCGDPDHCPADMTNNGHVGFDDLMMLLSHWRAD